MRSDGGGADAWWRAQTKFCKAVVMIAKSEMPKRIPQMDHASLWEPAGFGFFARSVGLGLN